MVVSAGQARAGAVLSTIVMSWSQDAELPQASVAVQTRVIDPVPVQPPPVLSL